MTEKELERLKEIKEGARPDLYPHTNTAFLLAALDQEREARRSTQAELNQWATRAGKAEARLEEAEKTELFRVQETIVALDRVDVLEKALRDVFALIEEGFLVRDTSKDSDPLWMLNSLRFVTRLKQAYAALSETQEVKP